MGKSNPTYRDLLNDYEERMQPCHRAMRRQHQPAFDRVFEHAHLRSAPAGMVNDPDIEKLALFSMLVGIQQNVLELRRELGIDDAPVSGGRTSP